MQLLGITKILSDCIIRPPRCLYTPQDLGRQTFCHSGEIYERVDMDIPIPKKQPIKQNFNQQGIRSRQKKEQRAHISKTDSSIILKASLFAKKYEKTPRNTIIYLHANSSSRTSVKGYLETLIKQYDIVAFDFRGCGQSENSEYITLGYLEKYDVHGVIQFINQNYGERKYALWGRSMGAVTAILYAAQFKKHAACLILDSPFCDLERVINELVQSHAPIIPGFLTGGALSNVTEYISNEIQNAYGSEFDFRKLKPINAIKKIKIPIMFVGGEDDNLVNVQHIRDLYELVSGRKQVYIIPGGHNQVRPRFIKNKAVSFLQEAFKGIDIPQENIKRRKIFDLCPAKFLNLSLDTQQIQQTPPETQRSDEQKVEFTKNMGENILDSLVEHESVIIETRPLRKQRIFSRQPVKK